MYLNHDLFSLVLSHNIDDLDLMESLLAEYPEQTKLSIGTALRIALSSMSGQEVEILGSKKILQYLSILWRHDARYDPSSDIVNHTAALGLTALLAYYIKEYNFQAYLPGALVSAAQHGQIETIKYILTIEDVRRLNIDTALVRSIPYGYTSSIRLLLDNKANILPGVLTDAAQHGCHDTIKLLLQHKANVNEKKTAPLMRAVTNGYGDIVKLLLESKANLHARNDDALMLATGYDRVDIAEILIDQGIAANTNNNRVLMRATANGSNNTIKLLLEKKADLHAQNDAAMFNAIATGHADTVKLLLDSKVDIRGNNGGWLLDAVAGNHYSVVKVLLDNGINVRLRQDEALCFAKEKGHTELIELLRQYGAKDRGIISDIKDLLSSLKW